MKNVSLRNTSIAALLLATLGYPGFVSAHTQSGTLGSSAGAVDIYQVNCSDDGNGDPAMLVTSILDRAPLVAPVVSVVTIKDNVATSSSDAKDGDAVFSPEVYAKGGDSVYYVAVTKSAAGAELYTLDYHCLTEAGVHTGTDIYPLQNK